MGWVQVLRRELDIDAVLERCDHACELRRLLAKHKAAGAVDQVELRGALMLGDHLEENVPCFAARSRVMACPHDLGRDRQTLAEGFPDTTLEGRNPEVALAQLFIAHGRDRKEAIERMQRALHMFIVEGIHTSIPLHQRILDDPDFKAGNFDTNFVTRFMKS